MFERMSGNMTLTPNFISGCPCVAPLITAFRQAEEFFIVMPYIEHEDFRVIDDNTYA